MTGIRYITNDKSQTTDLIISLKEHGQIVEDLLDALIVEERRNEETIPFEDFVTQLKSGGKLDE